MFCLASQSIRVNWVVSLSDYETGSSLDANVDLLQSARSCSQVTNIITETEILLDFYLNVC